MGEELACRQLSCGPGTYFIRTIRDYACEQNVNISIIIYNWLIHSKTTNNNNYLQHLNIEYGGLNHAFCLCNFVTHVDVFFSQAFMTRSPRISGFQSSQVVSKPSAKRMQKFLKCPLLTRDSEEQAVISVLSMVRTRAEPVSKSML